MKLKHNKNLTEQVSQQDFSLVCHVQQNGFLEQKDHCK